MERGLNEEVMYALGLKAEDKIQSITIRLVHNEIPKVYVRRLLTNDQHDVGRVLDRYELKPMDDAS